MTFRFASGFGLVIIVATALEASPAHAEEPPARAITVRPSSCAELPWSPSAWIDLLRVELAADRVRVESSETTGVLTPYTISIEPASCEGNAGSATLIVSSGDSRRTQTLNLVDVAPAARPRVLAIAMADLVRQGTAATEATSPTPPVRPVIAVRLQPERPPAGRVDPASTSPKRSISVLATAETKMFAQGNTGLYGPRAGARFALGTWLVFDGDAGVLWGSAHDVLGDIRETVATFGVGTLATGATKNVSFGVGPRLEAGAGWFRGSASQPLTVASSARSAVALLALTGTTWFAIDGSFLGVVGFDVGTTLYGFGARADSMTGERSVSDVRGPFLAARLGFAWRFEDQSPRSTTK